MDTARLEKEIQARNSEQYEYMQQATQSIAWQINHFGLHCLTNVPIRLIG
jgi:hypothetical protein